MDNEKNTTIEINEEEIKPQKTKKLNKSKEKEVKTSKKRLLIICITLGVLVAGGVVGAMILLKNKPSEPQPENNPETPAEAPKYYSRLSGLEIEKDALNNSPIFCMQVPNGIDGARPHVGLQSASVVFEAIAEAGITRFAAIFQNPESTVLGPIRSLRPYYLEWDTPFGCTIIHAGGSYEALAALRSGGYKEIDEGTYTWRDGADYIAPNNLFTDVKSLDSFAAENSLAETGKNAKTFPRLLSEEALKIREDAQAAAADKTNENGEVVKGTPLVTNIAINFGNSPDFNPRYVYNPETGLYARSYESGEEELSYHCTKEIPVMSRDCKKSQIEASAVVAMEVTEGLADDNYHQTIETIGEGVAYIFQNGKAIKGTWSKASPASQIVFKDESGAEISFAPGLLWISAIPSGVGSVEY